MNGKIKYKFTAKTWQHSAPSGWHFVSLPTKISTEIRENLKWQEEGWGRLKADIRKKEKIGTDKDIKTIVWI
ncbi:DUF1905 domain-containing protein [Sediminibacterium sp.]|uniref:DUF1905 domain-containing protein n=1 Tax=Sediminibacterium sp. TaxID=1917865 RepID=UPI00273186FE|nr:DUF1905 domain-containing protein [Sediminibacterium sp.]MDP1972410.1 DUF1905 domain-containing protein [Sediminibacterium sp.]MDP2419722.1 DUF1905 domain-containing protein [Sediminibacterium sp.]